jgi:rhodanese-related sulfurtransferase
MQEQETQGCIAKAELQQLIKQSPELVTIIDVRRPEEYSEKHIPGAINIPLTELENRSGELSKEATIISACGKGGGRSEQAAVLLKQMGFAKARFLCGGTAGWYEFLPQKG